MLVMSMLLLTGPLLAQDRTVTGKITDETGAPIPFVSVVIKGKSTTGTTTNQDGNFKISASKDDVLLISGVGYVTKEVKVGSGTTIDVALVPAKDILSEVVVTGMGIRKTERALGYAVSKVDPNTMVQKSEPNVLNTLAGKVPGVDIRAGQGAPGAASRIQIRGCILF